MEVVTEEFQILHAFIRDTKDRIVTDEERTKAGVALDRFMQHVHSERQKTKEAQYESREYMSKLMEVMDIIIDMIKLMKKDVE